MAGEHSAAARERDRIDIVEAPDIIEMSAKPTAALRKNPNSSMVVGLKLQVEGKSDAFVSAGSTGAQMAASAMLLKLQPGLTRPAIATVFPTIRNPVVVLDSGANVDCSTKELLQFAWLGAVYAECIFGRTKPSVGLSCCFLPSFCFTENPYQRESKQSETFCGFFLGQKSTRGKKNYRRGARVGPPPTRARQPPLACLSG